MKNKTEKRKGNYGHKHSEATKTTMKKPCLIHYQNHINLNKRIMFSCENCGVLRIRTQSRCIGKRRTCSHKCNGVVNNKNKFKKGNQINKGRKLSKEHRKKIGIKSKQCWKDPQYRANQLNRMIGHKVSPETYKKIAAKTRGDKHWTRNRPYPEAAREKQRKARMHQVFPIKDSKPEKMMQTFLTVNKIKFRTHEPIMGQPDIFIEPDICLFVDGCHWHGCQECYPDQYKKYSRIEKQMLRDIQVTHKLMEQGYVVLRIWTHCITPEFDKTGILNLIKNRLWMTGGSFG